jgi:hypothetical protein
VNIPPDDVHLSLGKQQCGPQRREVFGGVIENGDPEGFAAPPDGLTGNQDG